MRFRGQSVGAETTVDHTSMEDVLEQEMVLYAVIVIGLVDASQTMMVPSFAEVMVADFIMTTSCLRVPLRCYRCSPVLEEY